MTVFTTPATRTGPAETDLIASKGEILNTFAEAMFNEGFTTTATAIDKATEEKITLYLEDFTSKGIEIETWFNSFEDSEVITLNMVTEMLKDYL